MSQEILRALCHKERQNWSLTLWCTFDTTVFIQGTSQSHIQGVSESRNFESFVSQWKTKLKSRLFVDNSPVIYCWLFQSGASVVVYYHCHCYSTFCMSSTFQDILVAICGEELSALLSKCVVLYEPRHEKTCIRGLQPGKTQIGLLS